METPDNAQFFRVFSRIGLFSFGGPAAQIALMHKELVDDRQWLSEDSFLRALSLCMLLPGPEAMQLATYAGWRLRGTSGGLIAGLLFVLPGATVIFLLAMIYAQIGQVPLVQAAFVGIKATVISIVLMALFKVSRKALTTPLAWVLASASFVALFFFATPYPIIIALAAFFGALLETKRNTAAASPSRTSSNPLRVFAIWGALWAIPVAIIALIDHAFLLQIATFFSTLAVVTFGGAYAVLTYMTQTAVTDFGWISTAQMIDALGLAETTPGPLILVTQFVAVLAGYSQGGSLLAIAAGITALWVTFIPCFLWIFLAGPYLDHIAQRPRLAAALKSITAAVVGVILNLTVWFSVHVLFEEVAVLPGTSAPLPVFATLDLKALTLSCLAGFLMLKLKRNMAETLSIAALAGLCLSLV
ncbi:MAG: chromate efflux transporter [Roseobacter sp.]